MCVTFYLISPLNIGIEICKQIGLRSPSTRHEAYMVRHRQRKVSENLEAHKEKLQEDTREAEELESERTSELPEQT